MIQEFKKREYEIINNNEKADIYVINTCTVTNMSDRKSRQMLRKVKEKNQEGIIIVCGCYAQVAGEELKQLKEIDLVIGNNEKRNIVQYIEKYIKDKEKTIEIEDIMKEKEFKDFGDVIYTEKTRAVIKVQDGCDRFCSYCIIPYARGSVRSRKPKSITSEIEKQRRSGN